VAIIVSNKMDFNSCANWNGFPKSSHILITDVVEVVEFFSIVLPCTSTSTAKLVKCVAAHSIVLPVLMVDTPSSDQEFLYTKSLLMI